MESVEINKDKIIDDLKKIIDDLQTQIMVYQINFAKIFVDLNDIKTSSKNIYSRIPKFIREIEINE